MPTYHVEAVEELPDRPDARKGGARVSKVQKILARVVEAGTPGQWYLIGTYSGRYGAAKALANLKKKVPGDGWEGEAIPYIREGEATGSRLYVRAV